MSELTVKPIWDDVSLPAFPALDRSVDVDVLVVGAGIAGITAACLLKHTGRRVALLERRKVGGVDTGCTSAHLTAVVDTDLPSLASSIGRDHAGAVWDAGFAAIDQIDALVAELGIECEFAWVPGFRHAPFDAADCEVEEARKALDEEAQLASDFGFDVTRVERTPFVDRPGWRIENQAVFHPRKYLRALLDTIPGDGSLVCEDTEVTFDEHAQTDIVAAGHRVRAPHVVLTTHTPMVGRISSASAAMLQTQLAYYTSYVAASALDRETPPGCYWDTSEPYRYLRIDRGGARLRLIAGGEDHKTGQCEDTRQPFAALARWIEAIAPRAAITHRWSGQVIETVDGLPLIGDAGQGQFVATGFGGNGMTFGTLAAMMARDAIAGTINPWADLFAAGRAAIARGPWDYVRENADYPYYMIRDRFAGAGTRSLRAVRRGEGRLVEIAGHIVAASRDSRGRLTTLSPVCTHMGCRVAWNAAEQTWDCPCHGSRFTASGEVLAGPAGQALEPVAPASGARARPPEPVSSSRG
jgi:glycine/D-amino acid oxidase-like deaminating enzyme/nitrite reductase/ring-hydroxylating ferredoxin subunit